MTSSLKPRESFPAFDAARRNVAKAKQLKVELGIAEHFGIRMIPDEFTHLQIRSRIKSLHRKVWNSGYWYLLLPSGS